MAGVTCTSPRWWQMALLTTRRSRLRAIAATGALAAAAAAGPAIAGSHPAAITGPFEAKLTHNAHYAEGEPSIAVNPRNPNNIILTFLANTGFGVYGVQNNTTPTPRDYVQPIQGCDYLLTFNAGRTWSRHELPMTNLRKDPARTNCSDTLVQFDQYGVAYVLGSAYQFPGF